MISSEDEDEDESLEDNSNMDGGAKEDPAAVDEEGAPETPAQAIFYAVAMVTNVSKTKLKVNRFKLYVPFDSIKILFRRK